MDSEQAYSRDLLATQPQPPWTNPLNWDLHFAKGDRRIPFHSYIRRDPVPLPSAGENSQFPRFQHLPVELQLRVLSFCDAPSLFQIMRVASILRVEASKLFWADQNAYYLVEREWLISGGHPGCTSHDLDFLRHVQNVEVEYDESSESKMWLYEDVIEQQLKGVERQIADNFWKSLSMRFPSLKKVVIHQPWSLSNGKEVNISQISRTIASLCPPHIDVYVFVREQEDPPTNVGVDMFNPLKGWYRALCQPTASGGWEKIAEPWNRDTILIPMRSSVGPVGKYERIKYIRQRLVQQNEALWPLLIEAIDREHFDNGRSKPFHCPKYRCGHARFEEAGQWSAHAAESHSITWDDDRFVGCLVLLPDELKNLFQERVEGITSKTRWLFEEARKIREDWREEDGEHKSDIAKAWMQQLENDDAWDTGTEAKHSILWHEFFQDIDPVMEAVCPTED